MAAIFSYLSAAPFQTLGMLRTPDAYVLPHSAAEFMFVGYYRNVAKPVDLAGFYPYAMAGLGLYDRLELGLFAGDKVENEPLVYFLNFKVKALAETPRWPQISVGIDNIFSPQDKRAAQEMSDNQDFAGHPDAANYEYYSMYAVASKQMVIAGMPMMMNAGLGTNRFAGQVARSRVFNGIFFSTEVSPMQDLSLQAEYDGHEFNAGVKYSYNNWGFKVGAQALEDLAKDNGYEKNLRLAFGLSYLWDRKAEAKRRRPDLRRFASDEDMDQPFLVDKGDIPQQPGVSIPGGSEVPGPEVVVVPTPTGTDTKPPTGGGTSSSVTLPGTTLQTPGMAGTEGSSSYSQLSPEVRDLLNELKQLREENEKAQKSLEDLRSWIQELKKPKE